MYQHVAAADSDPQGSVPLIGGVFLQMFLGGSEQSDCTSHVGSEISDWRRPKSRRDMGGAQVLVLCPS